MTVEINDTVERYTISGVGPYAFSFRIFDEDEIFVQVDGGNEDTIDLAINTHYTVSGVDDEDGGTVTLTAAAAALYAGDTLDIRSNTAEYQPTSIRNQGSFLPEVHEDAFDRLARQIQDLSRKVSGAVRYPDDEIASAVAPKVNSRKGRYLFANAVTGLFEWVTSIATTALSQPIFNQYLADSDPYKRTAAEIAAGVTPSDYGYQPGHVKRYGAVVDGAANDAVALQSAIDVASAGRGEVSGIEGVLLVSSQVNLKSNVTIRGDGFGKSFIRASANSFSPLSDNGTSISNVVISDLTIEAVSAGTSNRGLWFNANTANVTSDVLVDRCRFRSMFRGIECDRVNGLKIRDCIFTGLTSVGVYVGETNSTGRSTKVSMIGCTFKENGGADTEGGLVVSYADEVETIGCHFETVGATSGSTNLYHACYYRTCTQGIVSGNTFKTLRRGAAVHIFANVSGGESRNSDITILGNTIEDAENYVGIRCDYVDNLTISNNTVRNSYNNGVYVSNIRGGAITSNVLLNNNEEGASGTAAGSAIRAEALTEFTITGNVAKESVAVGAQYAQGCFLLMEGTCDNGAIQGNTFIYSGSTSNGYYFCDASGAISRTSFTGNTQNGASSFFNEGTTCVDLSFFGNIVSNNGAGTGFLTPNQLRRFPARGNFNLGAPFAYESDGINVTARLSAAPSTDTWAVGDKVWYTAPAAGGAPGAVCTTAGTPGTWKAMSNLAA